MDKGGDQNRVLTKLLGKRRHEEEDRLSNLPESLLCRIMLNIPSKDVVKSCVLSKRWRNLWRCVPALTVEDSEFRSHDAFVSFVDSFFGLNREFCFQCFKLRFDSDENGYNTVHAKRWINTVVKRKVKHFDVLDYTWANDEVKIPSTVYTCESLVSLKLCNLLLATPKFVSLPCVKVINLSIVKVANVLVLEKLISSCPVLESLTISRSSVDDIDVLRVCSRSLLRFKHVGDCSQGWDNLEVAIDAPRLEYLSLVDHKTARLRIENSGSLAEADINVIFNIEKLLGPNDLPKRNMIRDFLVGISNVNKLFISWYTFQVIYEFSKCEVPLFHNLSSLHADLEDHGLEMLSTFLESCPNLKSLVVEFKDSPEKEEGFRVLSVPRCFLTSLEYVKIVRPITGETRGMKLVSYILENSAILKKLTLCLDNSRKKEESVIFKELLTIPRLSTSCRVIVR